MSDTVRLIIEIDSRTYNDIKVGRIYSSLRDVPQESVLAIAHGIPLDSNSERAEVQAYFDGEAYGWEQGRKALLDDVKAEIKTFTITEKSEYDIGFNDAVLKCFNILNSIDKESEVQDADSD